MPERRDLLLAEGGPGGDRAMENTLQHATAALVAGLQATGTGGNLGPATGAWGCGKRYAFPTSPHPRLRLRANIQRGVTLTFHLVQKIGQVTCCYHIHVRSITTTISYTPHNFSYRKLYAGISIFALRNDRNVRMM